MTIREYQKEAFRTCASLGTDKLDLAHMTMGILSEWHEFIDAVKKADNVNCIEELVDMIWYIAGYCTFRGYDLQDLLNEDKKLENSFLENTSVLQDYVKKYVAYSKEIDKEKEKVILTCLINQIIEMIKIYSSDVSNALQNNIDKLRIRFPESFSEEKANNRDLDAERIELEK